MFDIIWPWLYHNCRQREVVDQLISVVTNCKHFTQPALPPSQPSRPALKKFTWIPTWRNKRSAEVCHSGPCPFIFNGEVPQAANTSKLIDFEWIFPQAQGEINTWFFQLNSSKKTDFQLQVKRCIFSQKDLLVHANMISTQRKPKKQTIRSGVRGSDRN